MGQAGLYRQCFIYVELRLLNVRTTLVPFTLLVPLVEVNSPVSFESWIFPAKLDSNFRSPNSITSLKLTLPSSRLTFLRAIEP